MSLTKLNVTAQRLMISLVIYILNLCSWTIRGLVKYSLSSQYFSILPTSYCMPTLQEHSTDNTNLCFYFSEKTIQSRWSSIFSYCYLYTLTLPVESESIFCLVVMKLLYILYLSPSYQVVIQKFLFLPLSISCLILFFSETYKNGIILIILKNSSLYQI